MSNCKRPGTGLVCFFVLLYPAFYLTFRLTGVHFRDELQHTGDVREHKFKYGPIRTWEITDIRLLYELYGNGNPNNIYFFKVLVIDVVLMFLLLTLIIFHTFF